MNYKTSLTIALSLLTSCVHSATDVVAPFVCLTGLCSSTEERLAAIQWSPSKLDKNGCQSIDGEYKDNAWKNSKSRESLIRHFDFRLHRDDKNPREAGMQENYEIYQKTPSTQVERIVIHTPIERVGGKYIKMPPVEKKVMVNDESDFYKNAVTSIKQQGNLLEVTLTDTKGTPYQKSTLNLTHPQIGCVDGILTIRTMSIGSGGVDGAYGSASAIEKKYTKLFDGSLQISISRRGWYYTSARGLIGIDANNRASGTEPRKSEFMLIFPSFVP
jgi:hypothetical protein